VVEWRQARAETATKKSWSTWKGWEGGNGGCEGEAGGPQLAFAELSRWWNENENDDDDW
jgi:hypothetical protein